MVMKKIPRKSPARVKARANHVQKAYPMTSYSIKVEKPLGTYKDPSIIKAIISKIRVELAKSKSHPEFTKITGNEKKGYTSTLILKHRQRVAFSAAEIKAHLEMKDPKSKVTVTKV